jgi:deoxyribose-phosphate aldolase
MNSDEIKLLCKICADCEADYVKTSTGFAAEGATVEAVKLMRKFLPAKTKIKAAGGIKNRKMAEGLITAGANRIGCSASIAIITEEALTEEKEK